MNRKVIYTYYMDIYERMFGIDHHTKLLAVWKESWESQGWQTVVLGPDDAKKNPKYKQYLKRFKTFPSLNHKDYELSCFLRWVAMEYVGDGYHCDYDVMNYGFHGEGETELTFYSKYMVPCMVYGRKEDWTRMLDLFMKHKPTGQNHVSDQSILVENVDTFPHRKRYMCPELNQEQNAVKYELVHYPNGVMNEMGLQPRHVFIKVINDIVRVFHESQENG